MGKHTPQPSTENNYDRTPCKCINCEKRKVQQFGLFCETCANVFVVNSRVAWDLLPRVLFEKYAEV
jgi:hypothetical protein